MLQSYVNLYEANSRTLAQLLQKRGLTRESEWTFIDLAPAEKLAYLAAKGAWVELQLAKGMHDTELVLIDEAFMCDQPNHWR